MEYENKEFNINAIASNMFESGLSVGLISRITKAAENFDGLYDLMIMWQNESGDEEEQNQIVDTIKIALEDIEKEYSEDEISNNLKSVLDE